MMPALEQEPKSRPVGADATPPAVAEVPFRAVAEVPFRAAAVTGAATTGAAIAGAVVTLPDEDLLIAEQQLQPAPAAC